MKGEYISIETARIMADIEKENKRLQEENEKLKMQKVRAIEYIKSWQRYHKNLELENRVFPDEIPTLLSILQD